MPIIPNTLTSLPPRLRESKRRDDNNIDELNYHLDAATTLIACVTKFSSTIHGVVVSHDEILSSLQSKFEALEKEVLSLRSELDNLKNS